MNQINTCARIFSGEGALDHLLLLPRDKVVVITDAYTVDSAAFRAVTARLAENFVDYVVFQEVGVIPSVEAVAAGVDVILAEKPNLMIAVGGNAAIDAAKAMLYFCLQQKRKPAGANFRRPVFAIVSTVVSRNLAVLASATIYDLENGAISLDYPCMIPKVAIFDPSFANGPDMKQGNLEVYDDRNGNISADDTRIRTRKTNYAGPHDCPPHTGAWQEAGPGAGIC